ncbi:MAG: NAD-dependent epimerase [Dysgonamonadaceae bacterium]|jgi:UDP-glucuronate 4-epimerase|nr:NAD-dependent epimerase [Dysgonamonadaceae bacterium]
MKVLVTGAAGFIGFHVAKQLIERGDEVVGLDNINNYYDINLKLKRLFLLGINKDEIKDNTLIHSNIYKNYKFIKVNIEDEVITGSLFHKENFDFVCHLAAQAGVRYSIDNPQIYIKTNIDGFFNILNCCKEFNIKHFVYASSSSVYGLNAAIPFRTSDPANHPISIYAATKKANELMAHTYSYLFKLPTTGLRFFTVYGPWGRPDMSPMLFAQAISKGEILKVFNYGNMERDFTYIDDIVAGTIKILDNPAAPSHDFDTQNPDPSVSLAPYRIYNIGSSSPVKLIDYINILEAAFGKKVQKEYIDMQQGDILRTYSDVSPLEKDFNYKPKTSLVNGIGKFVEWYKKYEKQILIL